MLYLRKINQFIFGKEGLKALEALPRLNNNVKLTI